jgi:hypothetical protein
MASAWQQHTIMEATTALPKGDCRTSVQEYVDIPFALHVILTTNACGGLDAKQLCKIFQIGDGVTWHTHQPISVSPTPMASHGL